MAGPSDRDPASRRPLLAVGLYLAFTLLHVAIAWDGGRLITAIIPGFGPWLGPVGWATYAVAALLVVAVLRCWSRTGLTRRPGPGWLRLIAVPVAANLPFLALGINLDPELIVPLLVVGAPLIALNEELFYRGVMLDLLRPRGWHSAVLGSAVLFGAGHLVNIVAGSVIPFTAMQVAATTAGGITLAAIRVRTGSLWPVIVAHVVIDVVAVSTLTGPATSSPLLLPVLFTWLGTNLLLWRYGWGLLAGRTDAQLDSDADGHAIPDGAPDPGRGPGTVTATDAP